MAERKRKKPPFGAKLHRWGQTLKSTAFIAKVLEICGWITVVIGIFFSLAALTSGVTFGPIARAPVSFLTYALSTISVLSGLSICVSGLMLVLFARAALGMVQTAEMTASIFRSAKQQTEKNKPIPKSYSEP